MGAIRAVLLGVFLWSLCGVAAAQVIDPPVVVDSFERARNQGNIDAALAYFADDATLVVQDRGSPVVGKSGIRGFLQLMRQPPLLTSNRHVVGNTVTWTERHLGPQRPVDLTVQAIVRDGKIRSLTYGLALASVQATTAEASSAVLGAPITLSGLATLAIGLLAMAALMRRREPSTSALRGKLVSCLAEWRPAADKAQDGAGVNGSS